MNIKITISYKDRIVINRRFHANGNASRYIRLRLLLKLLHSDTLFSSLFVRNRIKQADAVIKKLYVINLFHLSFFGKRR